MFLDRQMQTFKRNSCSNHPYKEENHRFQRTLQTLVDHVRCQSCENERICQTVRALETQYHRRMNVLQQDIHQLDQTLLTLDEQLLRFQEERDLVKTHLQQLEAELPLTQRLAIKRQDKRAGRQRRYDRYYWVPVVARWCKAKYMRARDKHVVAEHRIAQIREALEGCKDASGRVMYALDGLQQEYHDVLCRRSDNAQELVALEKILNALLDRCQFWCDFEANQGRKLVESAQQLTLLDDHPRKEIEFTAFQKVCLEYRERLSVGKERWGPMAVEFECVACNTLRSAWPTLAAQGLVCDRCCSRFAASQGPRQKLLEYKNRIFPREATANYISLKHRVVNNVLCKLGKSGLINRSLSRP